MRSIPELEMMRNAVVSGGETVGLDGFTSGAAEAASGNVLVSIVREEGPADDVEYIQHETRTKSD